MENFIIIIILLIKEDRKISFYIRQLMLLFSHNFTKVLILK